MARRDGQHGAARLAIVSVLVLALGGCSVSKHARSVVDPSQASMPRWIDVPTAIAAGERVLLARGYTIVRDISTDASGEVLGSASEDPTAIGPTQKVLITARASQGGTIVRVSHLPWHNRDHASVVLREMHEELGLH
ncbi:MAG: hypothetical protein ACF8GE_11335 [Phycisphaerales bacterium JB043]